MSHALDPLKTSRLISETYRRYLRSLLQIRDPQISDALRAEIVASPILTKGPLLEANPPYATGSTLAELIVEGVLHPSFRALEGPALPVDRPLYQHQESALRKAVVGRNLVVATGTGSGKTESFLIPILNALSREHDSGTLTPGVRALLLYPMNALANDQLKRLRGILAEAPHISFGRYTGDTPESRRVAAETFESLNPGAVRLRNELLSREEMRATPPHILLTNYAMLEYLLLRPADIDLFDGPHRGALRFIALDEAHVYDGAKAAEVAMLLRRLHDRVAAGQALQYIATSATMGDNPRAVTEFATKLFGAPFEWLEDDPSRQDLVRAARTTLPAGPFWGPLPSATYRELATSDDPGTDLTRLAQDHGFTAESAADALVHERSMAELRRSLATTPLMFADAAQAIFPEDAAAEEALADLVTIGAAVSDTSGTPVLSARYHLFARATEGAFTCLTPSGPHVSLSRREVCDTCDGAVFEFGACKRCGAVHLLGALQHDGTGLVFTPRVKNDDSRVWLLLTDTPGLADEDDETLEESSDSAADDALLCATCGGLYAPPRSACARPGCGQSSLRQVRRLKTRLDEPTGCLVCGARGSAMIRKFESGGEAAAAVLSTALYQALPPSDNEELADQPGEGRKLLLFSDSRQAAAFFAPYLESTYATVQHRRLILLGLAQATAKDATVTIDDLVFHVAKAADSAQVFERRMSRQQRERTAALWVTQELVALDERQSLEGLGLVRVDLDRDPGWRIPSAFAQLGLSDDESWAVLGQLATSIRQQGVLTMPDGVDPRDEVFDPRRGPIYARENNAEAGRKVLSWLPTRGANRRLNYMQRLLISLDSTEDAAAVLRGCWKFLTSLKEGWLSAETVRVVGTVHQVDHSRLLLGPVTDERPVYRCSLCGRVTAFSIRAVCPTLGCAGKLSTFVITATGDDDHHYRNVYQSMTPVPLTAREHTAQWTSLEAADIQQRFLRGQINVLSCSTTFELGVDVGELQSVMLRNMPPTTANYIQRAGRAGRRTDSAALVVTYAQRRAHDLSKYQDPLSMVAGQVRAPYVPLSNERIDRRHAHSIALAAFFRFSADTAGELWRTAGDFFLPLGGAGAPSTRVRDFLTPLPAGVAASIRHVLPAEIQVEIGVESGEWVDRLDELLEEVRAQLDQDVSSFTQLRQDAFDNGKDWLVSRYAKTINTLTRRDLLGYLANRNVLPKYGFPVDTVELRTAYSDEPIGAKLELQRDLSTAIYEYAPGGEVVAGGILWRSGGIYRLPDRELVGKYYAVCEQCQHYRENSDPLDAQCPSCDHISKAATRQYVVPEFGFVAERHATRPTTSPPRRSWNGATYVLSLAAQVEERQWRTANGGTITCRAGSRGRLIALSEGPTKAGYLICDWCGAGVAIGKKAPTSHQHLLRGTDCNGPLRLRSLAHPYETDILEITFDSLSAPPGTATDGWRSALYAILEGAAEGLEISRDDIDGTVYMRSTGDIGLVIFDTVPGGAGSVLRIANALGDVMASAYKRVSNCDCGEETSCYGCLRGYRNQRYHDELTRHSALGVLRPLAEAGGLT